MSFGRQGSVSSRYRADWDIHSSLGQRIINFAHFWIGWMNDDMSRDLHSGLSSQFLPSEFMIFGHTHGSRDGNISLLFGPLVGLPLWSCPNFCVYCQVFSDISSGTTMRFIFMVLREMSRPLLNGCHEIRYKHVPIRMICSNFGTPLNFFNFNFVF